MANNKQPRTRRTPHAAHDAAAAVSSYKSKNGLRRILNAARYSMLGLGAAWRHEAAFRQELGIGAVMLAAGIWIAPSLLHGVLMLGSLLLVLCVELLNSAIEALADAVSTDTHPLLGRAKDLGSAAVMMSMLIVALVWGAALYTYLTQV